MGEVDFSEALPAPGARIDHVDKLAAPGRMWAVLSEGYARGRMGRRSGEDTVESLLRRSRFLHSRERRTVAEAIFQALRHRRTWAWLLSRELEDPRARIGCEILASLVYFMGLAPERAAERQLDLFGPPAPPFDRLADLRAHFRSWEASRVPPPETRLGVAASVPDFFARSWIATHGPERALELGRALNRRAPLTVRANLLKIGRAELLRELCDQGIDAEPTPLSPDGLFLRGRVNAHALPGFRKGLFEVQDEGSQLLSRLVAPEPGCRLVDFCAGSGGKTLALAALVGNRGRILALDVRSGPLVELRRRCRRAGVDIVRCARIERRGPLPEAVLDFGGADRVLVDAPCSGSGGLRRHPEARWNHEEDALAGLVRRQLSILERASGLVRSGGLLVYATCSVLAEENERVVEAFLATHPGFEVVSVEECLGEAVPRVVQTGDALRLYPDVHETDGFYGHVLRLARV